MDNQITPQTGSASPQPQPTAPEPAPQVETQQPVVQPAKPKGRMKKFFLSLLVLVLLAAAAGGAYYWQHQQVTGLQKDKTALNKELSAVKAQLEQQKLNAKSATDVADKALATSSTSNDVLPGEVSKKTVNSATLGAYYKPNATLKAVWIEYSTDNVNFNKSTDHVTKSLGEGAPNTYVATEFNVTQLASGTQYYYRVAATEGDKTVHSGVASFTVLK